jgi:hypothetical protein
VLSWWRRLHALVMTACKTTTASARKTTPDCEFLVSLDQAVLLDGRLSVGVSWRANLSPALPRQPMDERACHAYQDQGSSTDAVPRRPPYGRRPYLSGPRRGARVEAWSIGS